MKAAKIFDDYYALFPWVYEKIPNDRIKLANSILKSFSESKDLTTEKVLKGGLIRDEHSVLEKIVDNGNGNKPYPVMFFKMNKTKLKDAKENLRQAGYEVGRKIDKRIIVKYGNERYALYVNGKDFGIVVTPNTVKNPFLNYFIECLNRKPLK